MLYGIIFVTIFSSIGNLATNTGTFYRNRLGRPSLASAGDVNGDGYDDFIYGQKNWWDYPAVYILFGGPTFDNPPDVILTYDPPYNGYFGWTVGCAGDVNSDGYDDVMVAKSEVYDPEDINGNEGIRQIVQKVYIYYGGANMDVLPDITIIDPNPPGSGYEFGSDLCIIDFCFDYPPDNFPDIVVGCPGKAYTELRGKVYVFRGPDYTEYIELSNWLPNYGNDRLGFSVTVADFNNDGIDEIVAGAPYWHYFKGAIVAWNAFGQCMDIPYVESPFNFGEYFGYDVASGDVTNDIYPDLFISAPRAAIYGCPYMGKVRVSYGFGGWGYAAIPVDDQELFIPGHDTYFGWSIAHCGDVNKDGIGDVIIGAHQGGNVGAGNGYVALYFGDDGELYNNCDLQLFGEASCDGFGWRVCGTGDMNGDGYADFGVSAPYNDAGGGNAGRVYVYGELNLLSSNPHALAYNGNRHLVRKPNSEELHLVYTSEDKVIYVTSSNGGTDWSLPEIIGNGNYPAISLSSDYLPSVAWTDDNGGLWYRRKISSIQWSDIYHLWNPVGVDPLRLNSPPSIAIHASNPNTVHILVTRTGGPPRHVNHRVEDYTFTITVPMQGTFVLIEQAHGPHDPPLRTFPSIARCEVNNSLHAVWQRSDTICYATKPREQPWNNWGWQFFEYGLQSAHPFVGTYGDSIFVVWQHLEPPTLKEEVYRAARHLPYPFDWENLSQTPNTKSLYPVNASGFFTVFNDEIEPPVDSRYEVFYKIEPDDPLTNISQTEPKSIYPQSVARFHVGSKYVYTAWLEGDEAPYGIRFKKIRYIEPDKPDMAYLSSSNGHNPSSLYLIARDSFISEWQIPVDIGYESITYQFPLEPGYYYKLKTVAYHEREDKWKTKVMIDNEELAEIEYEAYEPETLECWIPSEFYADSVVEIIFECDDGDFASVGPIFIYQYEYEEGEGGFPGGSMTQENQPINKCSFMITPNPFTQGLNIKFQNQTEKGISVKVYDVSGRLVKSLYRGIVNSNHTLTWKGNDDYGRIVAQGIYFLQIQNLNTDEIYVHKVIKIE